MVFDLPPTIYIAQVYNCDAYGAAAYNSCPETSTPSSSGSSNSSSSSSSSRSSTTTTQTDTTESDETPITDSPQPAQPTTPSKKPTSPQGNDIDLITPANTVAALEWTTIVPIALLLSVLVALIVLMFKKHRRNKSPLPPTY